MKIAEKPLHELSLQDMAEALKAVVPAGYATVTANVDLGGVVVEACCVEIYVMHDAAGMAIEVECWHPHSVSAFKTLAAATLDEAIALVAAEFDNS